MDTLTLTMQPVGQSEALRFRHVLVQTDTAVQFPLGDFRGPAVFDATIQSKRGMRLHSGHVEAVVSGGVLVRVALTAERNIMLVSPDTLRVATPPPNVYISDSVKVYNRGIGTLRFFLADIQPPRSPGNCAVNCMRFRDVNGFPVVEGDSMYARIDSITSVAGPVSYTLRSGEGDLVIVVMRRP